MNIRQSLAPVQAMFAFLGRYWQKVFSIDTCRSPEFINRMLVNSERDDGTGITLYLFWQAERPQLLLVKENKPHP
jgi:hypothetical protein